MKIPYSLLLLSLIILALPYPAAANPCTDGVDCYCDRVQGGELNDPDLLVCEDFEAVTLHDNVNVGGGSPLFGPWYDDTGFSGARGNNNYWFKTYGPAVRGCSFRLNIPPNPILGDACAFDACMPTEWRADNLWESNDTACIDIVRAGEFDDEVASNAELSNAAGGGVGPFDGAQSLGHRVATGEQAGVGGGPGFGTQFELGMTMALGYDTNSAASGIWGAPWKHNEWPLAESVGGQSFNEAWLTFHNKGNLNDEDPWHKTVMRYAPGTSDADCNAVIAAGNVRAGEPTCGGTLQWNPLPLTPADYLRSRDFPLGTWGCVRGHYFGMGTSNMGIKITFLGPGDTVERTVIDFDGFDGTKFLSRGGIKGLLINSYANANQGLGETPTTQATRRYEDNWHIRAGPPVSCAQIGFSGGDSAPPAAPANLRIQ